MSETRFIGQKEISLPAHMTSLPQHVIDVLIHAEDANDRIVCCGIDPQDGGLYIITGTCDVRVIMPNGRLIPTSAFPSHDGKTVGLTMSNVESLQTIASRLAVQASKSCLETFSLNVGDTYIGTLNVDAGGADETDDK